MAEEEYSRADYLRILFQQKKETLANGGNLVNPAVSNDNVSQLAEIDSASNNSFEAYQVNSNPENNTGNFLNDLWNDIVSVGEGFVHGVGGAIEGIIDFGANIASGIGSAFGNDMSDLESWIATDWTGKGTGALANAMIGNGWNENFESTLDTTFGNIVGGVASGIGQMLPSIALAGVTGGGSLVGLGTMMVGAAGQGSQTALSEGADSGQALLYGTATGAVEGLTEWIGGKLGGFIPGNEMAISSLKDAFKVFSGEAIEEMMSGAVEPLTQMIYKGEDALKDENGNVKYGTAEFWLTGQDSVAMQGLIGGLTGLAMSGARSVYLKKSLGNKYGVINDVAVEAESYQKIREFDEKYGMETQKFSSETPSETEIRSVLAEKGATEKEIKTYLKATNDFLKANYDIRRMTDEAIKEGPTKQNIKFEKWATNPMAQLQALKESQGNDEKEMFESILRNSIEVRNNKTNISKASVYDNLERINREFGTDFTVKFDNSISGKGHINQTTNTITLNPNYSESYTPTTVHEVFAHKVMALDPSKLQTMVDIIKKSGFDTAKVENAYQEYKDDAYSMNQEIAGHYFEKLFKSANGRDSLLLKKQLPLSIADKMLKISKQAMSETTNPEVLKALGEQTKVFIKTTRVLNDKLIKAFSQLANDTDKRVRKDIEKTIGKDGAEQIAYSRVLNETYNYDSEMNELSKEQKEFFKNSKARDENGKLVVVYHSTDNFGFTVFDENIGQFYFTNKENVSKTYSEKIDGNMYSVYLNLTNPLIINCDGSEWMSIKYESEKYKQLKLSDNSLSEKNVKLMVDVFKQYLFNTISDYNVDKEKGVLVIKKNFTNYEYDSPLDLLEHVDEYNQLKTYEISKIAKEEGYDGVIFKNVYDIGGKKQLQYDKENLVPYSEYEKEAISDVYVAFNSNQIKNIDNLNPTTNDDIRYSRDTILGTYEVGANKEQWVVKHDATGYFIEMNDHTPISDEERKKNKITGQKKIEVRDGTIGDKNFDLTTEEGIKGFLNEYKAIKKSYIKQVDVYQKRVRGHEETTPETLARIEREKAIIEGKTKLEETLKDKYKNGTELRINDGTEDYKFLLERSDKQWKITSTRLSDAEINIMFFDNWLDMKNYINTYTNVAEFKSNAEIQTSLPDEYEVQENETPVKIIERIIPQFYESDRDIEVSKLRANLNQPFVYQLKNTSDYLRTITNAIRVLGADLGKTNLKITFANEKLSRASVEALNEGADFKTVTNEIVDAVGSIVINDNGTKTDILNGIFNGDAKEYTKFLKLLRDGVEKTLITHRKEGRVSILKGKFNEALDLMRSKYNNMKKVSAYNKQVSKLRENVKKIIRQTNKVGTPENIVNHPLSVLTSAFTDYITSDQSGYKPYAIVNGEKISLKNSLTKLSNLYEEPNEQMTAGWNSTIMPYDAEIKGAIKQLIDLLPEPTVRENGQVIYSTMNAEQLKAYRDTLSMIRKSGIDAMARERKYYVPQAMASVQMINSYKNKHLISKFLGFLFKPGASASGVLTATYGTNPLVDQLVYAFNDSQSKADLFVGMNNDAIANYTKEHKGLSSELKKTVEIKSLNGEVVKMQLDQVLGTYMAITSNIDSANESGVATYNAFKKEIVLAAKNEKSVAKLVEQLKANLSPELLNYGKYLKEMLNGPLQQAYMQFYRERYGIESNEVSDYWMIARIGGKMISAEQMLKAPAMFGNSVSRQPNTNYFATQSATNSTLEYINLVARHLYVMPTYRDSMAMLNTKVGDLVLAEKLSQMGGFDKAYIDSHLKAQVGIMNSEDQILGRMMGNYSVAKLSFNIGSWLKQYISLFTSNVPVLKGISGTFSKVFKDKALLKEMDNYIKPTLDNGELNPDCIGSLAYRSGTAIVANTLGLESGVLKAFETVGMKGITAVDKFTIQCGLASIIKIGRSMGYEYGSTELAKFVKAQWQVFENSQVGSKANSINKISRGDYGGLFKSVFGVLQGANRACLGSFITKISTYAQFRNVDKVSVEKALAQAQSRVEVLNNEYNDIQIQIANAIDEDVILDLQDRATALDSEIAQAQSEVDTNESLLKGIQNYETMGGKTIPINVVAGLTAQAILVTLINKLLRKILKKEEWDEWDWSVTDGIGKDLLLNFTLNWIPVVNTISNKFFNDYDIEAPSVSVLNDAVDVIKTLQEAIAEGDDQKKWMAFVRATLNISEAFGIPAVQIKNYMTAIIKTANPELGLKIDNIWYGVSLNSMSKNYNEYIASGNTRMASAELDVIVSSKGLGSISKTENDEIVRLGTKGYSVSMGSSPTTYTDEKGNEVSLSQSEIDSFNNLYKKSHTAVDNMLSSAQYSKLDDEDKAKAISSVYAVYKQYSIAKITGTAPTTKLGQILYYSNGTANVSTYIAIMKKLQTMQATQKETRKEQVVKYLNSIKGISRAEKMLIMFLMGYSATDESSLIRALKSIGISNKNIELLLK